MPEEKQGVNTDQNAAGQQADSAQVASEQGVTGQSPAGDVDTNQDKGPVPYDRFKEVNDAKNAAVEAQTTAEQAAQQARDQLAVAMANTVQQVQPQVQQPLSTYEQAMADCGATAEELPYDGAMQVKVQNRKEQLEQIKQNSTQQFLANQQFTNTHPDYGEVVGRTNPATGQIIPSAEITEILQRKPHLTATAYASAQGAYNIVMDERKLTKFEKDQAALEEHQARTNVDTETQPLGASAAGGGVAGDVQQKMMTREQVIEIQEKLASGEAV